MHWESWKQRNVIIYNCNIVPGPGCEQNQQRYHYTIVSFHCMYVSVTPIWTRVGQNGIDISNINTKVRYTLGPQRHTPPQGLDMNTRVLCIVVFESAASRGRRESAASRGRRGISGGALWRTLAIRWDVTEVASETDELQRKSKRIGHKHKTYTRNQTCTCKLDLSYKTNSHRDTRLKTHQRTVPLQSVLASIGNLLSTSVPRWHLGRAARHAAVNIIVINISTHNQLNELFAELITPPATLNSETQIPTRVWKLGVKIFRFRCRSLDFHFCKLWDGRLVRMNWKPMRNSNSDSDS